MAKNDQTLALDFHDIDHDRHNASETTTGTLLPMALWQSNLGKSPPLMINSPVNL